MKIFLKTLGSTALLAIFLFILASPLLVSKLLVSSTLLGKGRVAGVQTQKKISIYPNLSDFNGYVNFDLKEVSRGGDLADNLQLTSFPGQIASYQNLYTIFNNTEQTLMLSIYTTQTLFSGEFQTVVLSARLADKPSFATLTKEAPPGTTWLPVNHPHIFNQDSDYVIINDTPVKKVAQNKEGLVIMPVNIAFSANSTVFPQSIFVKNQPLAGGQQLLIPTTQDIFLPPQQKLSVDATVKGAISSTQSSDLITLPLLFKVSLAKQSQQGNK